MKQHLSAETIARGIIAAAVSIGDDPIQTCTTRKYSQRRALAPAAHGIAAACGVKLHRVCTILGLNPNSASVVKSKGPDYYERAERAARDAVAWHLKVQAAREVALTEKPGRIASWLRPQFRVPEKVCAQSPAGDRVLLALRKAPASAPNLAIMLDLKELVVADALRQLEQQGLVEGGGVPDAGQRWREWRSIQSEAA